MITVDVVGAEILAARFRSEIRLFQLEQRKQMRVAANLVKRDVEAKVAAIFPAGTTTHKRRGATPLGPLRKKIGIRIIATTGDVKALIRPRASAFYGRFQETGLNVSRKSRTKNAFSVRTHKAVHGAAPFRLPRKPFLEPVAEADAAKVAEVIGDAYGVFYRGGA